jgi:ketosteroid isomerase-like protein
MTVTQADVIRRYYAACSAGDAEGVAATMCEDVVHYFLAPNAGSAPVRGADHLGRYWRRVQGLIEATWRVDHAVSSGEETVIEWSMVWTPQGSSDRVITRGAEWFVFRGERIAEIRSYYRQEDGDSELDGFPYAQRGYSLKS